MKEWLLWALFGCNLDGLREEWVDEIEGYLKRLEAYMGRKFEDGWSATAKCMRLTLDPVIMLHRPLLWYTVSNVNTTSSTLHPQSGSVPAHLSNAVQQCYCFESL